MVSQDTGGRGLAALAAVAGSVPDPELPELTLAELGVLRAVREGDGGRIVVELVPTYLGCPAVEVMAEDIRRALRAHGVTAEVAVTLVLSPPWSTDAISPEGRRKLAAAGIAPPRPAGPVFVTLAPVPCPRCGGADTALLSPFSGTACRALRRCARCREPFDHVKER
jgi:ring-1,2-phenylacetyl-CoA epoxidase subunit PaaD